MSDGRRVYIMNNGGHDYSAAKKYGELVFVTDELIDRENTSHMFHVISHAFKDAEADDYIMISSLTGMCMIAAAVFADKFGELNLLIHSRGEYIERSVMMELP